MLAEKNTKEKILDTAIDLFSQKGFSGVSIRDITNEVEIKESSLYNHFKNKDEILETILLLFKREFAKTIPPIDRLDEILENIELTEFLVRGFEKFKEHMSNARNEKCWRIVSNEQYRSAMARKIFLEDVIENTLKFIETLFIKLAELNKIKSTFDPKVLAAEYQYPVFSMLTEYNLLRFDQKDTNRIEEKMIRHIHFFAEMIKRD